MIGRNDEKYLVILFTIITAVLILILTINIRGRSSISPDQVVEARKQFTEQIPQLLNRSDMELQIQALHSDRNQIPELVLTVNQDLQTSNILQNIRNLVASQYAILEHSLVDSAGAIGVGYYGHPVGKIIVYGQNRSYRPATVGLIIDDFGYYDDSVTDGFFNLSPENLSVAIIPGHEDSGRLSQKAADNHFEILIHMPMEPIEYEGGEDEFILLEGMSSRQIISRLNKAFRQIPDATGLNNHMGSLATQDPNVMQPLLYLLRDENMFFIDSFTSSESVGYELAQKIGVPSARRTVFLDNEQDATYIKRQLEELVTIAREQRYAVGIGHAKEITLQVLQDMIPVYERQNVEFTRASEVVHQTSPVM